MVDSTVKFLDRLNEEFARKMAAQTVSTYVPVPAGYQRPGGAGAVARAAPVAGAVPAAGRGRGQNVIDGGPRWGNVGGLRSSQDPLKRFLCGA